MACDHCGRSPSEIDEGAKKVVMVPMKPGDDGKAWELCTRCWLEGARPERLGNIKLAADETRLKKGDKMGRSLITGDQYVATGELIVPRGRSAAKDDVGSFDREKKPVARFDGGVQYVPDEEGYW